MSASATCPHTNLRSYTVGEQFLDSNIRVLRWRVVCAACDQAFKAVGVRDGVSIDAPSTPDNGKTMVVPMIPSNEVPNLTTQELLGLYC